VRVIKAATLSAAGHLFLPTLSQLRVMVYDVAAADREHRMTTVWQAVDENRGTSSYRSAYNQ